MEVVEGSAESEGRENVSGMANVAKNVYYYVFFIKKHTEFSSIL